MQLQDSKPDPTACAPGIIKMLEEHTTGTPDICVLLWLDTESERKKKLSLKKKINLTSYKCKLSQSTSALCLSKWEKLPVFY